MKFSFQSFVILFFASIIGFTACKKLDDEPQRTEATLISRLYVSFLDYDQNNSALKNMMIIDPADTTNLDNIYQYLSPAKGGGPILFDAAARAIFQASVTAQDTFLQVIPFANEIYGIPGNAGAIGYTGFTNVRGLGYYTYAQQNGASGSVTTPFLLAVTNRGAGNSMLYAISTPSGKVGSKGGAPIIDKQINLGTIVPSSLTLLNSITSDSNEKLLLIGFNNEGTENKSGFAVYSQLKQELIDRARDTIVASTRFTPMMKVYINGKTGLGSVSYAPKKNLLAVTSGSEVLFFKDPKTLFSGATDKTNVEPDYVVGGANTGLVKPWGIAIDDRTEQGKFFYVSDLTNRTISRFPLVSLGEGNVKPDIAAKTYGSMTPNYIFLDAREANVF
ncbi:hypothetical protein HS960_16395 [Sphingobacterium paramultivorum]|uniref:DUF4374 domain-containing protein n=1 Tax=Sphingobacterium paramultivorum TaxID=2886510 RepID=A0A7G5E561_9SPHI|nr:hypothetical protein [Sphingobacterium paramultivorum]QMV69136.1 hypothetical protein HS960_16395 [Sphingobacterium paramultivorum]WSO12924.1 hypothetical protein VUL84_16400 [Sphingobacterium paramultivorum]